jgi:hypothetical protein
VIAALPRAVGMEMRSPHVDIALKSQHSRAGNAVRRASNHHRTAAYDAPRSVSQIRRLALSPHLASVPYPARLLLSLTTAPVRRGVRVTGLLLLFFLVCPVPTEAQGFHVGAWFVCGDMRYPIPNNTWGRWTTDTSAERSGDGGVIPSERWDQLLELGMTTAHFALMPQSVTKDERNVALRLSRAAHGRGLKLIFSDAVIRDMGEGERRLLHPESPLDFPGRNTGVAVMDTRAVRYSWGCDRHLLSDASENAVLFLPDADAGAHLITMNGAGMHVQRSGGELSGRYVVSLRLLAYGTLPESNHSEVVSVTVRAGADSLRFSLTGSEILSAFRNARGGLVEVLLGRLHLRESEAGELLLGSADVSPQAWNARTAGREAPRIILEYHGGLPLAVEALCFSDERGFALFNPDLAPPEYAGALGEVRERIRLLQADSTAPYPSLAWLEMAESLPEHAAWPITRRIAAMLVEAAGTRRTPVRPYVFTSGEATLDTQRIRASATMMHGLHSGFYVYPFRESYQATPFDAWYYDSTYRPASWTTGGRNTWTNFNNLALWYRHYARQRAAVGGIDWMPAIQNHSWQLKSGWPVHALDDTLWLREPTAAELRFNCNLALAYGATGILFYQFSSWPGLADTAVVTSRDSRYYGDMGSIGFLDPHNNTPRRRDTNGESKWDSTRASVMHEIRPAGELLASLRWRRGISVEAQPHPDELPLLRSLTSYPFGSDQPDPPGHSYVEVTEFDDPGDPSRVILFVLNKRVDPHGGRRLLLELEGEAVDGSRGAEVLHGVGRLVSFGGSPANMIVDAPPATAILLGLRKHH